MKHGIFITVEGGEGAGKSTSLAHIQSYLEQAEIEPLMTREPGGTPVGEEIRQLLLTHREGGLSPQAELLLMFAARAEHLRRVIHPALEEGSWVVCDRFTDASYAYQGGGRRLGFERVRELEHLVHPDFRPHATLLLDVPVEVGLARAGRRSELDRFESEDRAFQRRVRESYLQLAEQNPGRYHVVDATATPMEVQQAVERILAKLVARNKG